MDELASKYLTPSERAFDSDSMHSVTSTDYQVDPELKQREAEKLRCNGEEINIPDGSVRISSVEGTTDEDGYYVIESDPQNSVFPVGLDSPGTPTLDVNALASKLASLEVSTTVEQPYTRQTSDSSSSSGTAVRSAEVKEVMIDGGGVHSLPVTIGKTGTAIVWEFSTEPKGISFGIGYKERKSSEKEEEVRIVYGRLLTMSLNVYRLGVIVVSLLE